MQKQIFMALVVAVMLSLRFCSATGENISNGTDTTESGPGYIIGDDYVGGGEEED